MNLLMVLQEERNISSSLSKVFKIPVLGGNNGLDKYLTQFEAAIDSDFPKYQVLLPLSCLSMFETFLISVHLAIISINLGDIPNVS